MRFFASAILNCLLTQRLIQSISRQTSRTPVLPIFAVAQNLDDSPNIAVEEEYGCGDFCSPPLRNPAGLNTCLLAEFGGRSPLLNGVPILTFPSGDNDDIGDSGDQGAITNNSNYESNNTNDGNIEYDNDTNTTPKPDTISNPNHYSNYDAARATWVSSSHPSAIIYAHNTSDVQLALSCATSNGYQVSIRAHGHSYQGLSAMSGYVVIDLRMTCTEDALVAGVDRTKSGEHILPGSRYIATVEMPAGCTNAAMYSFLQSHFTPEEKAMAVLGTYPSVGVSGCTLGGCSGDITPYAGYAIDTLEEVEIVLFDGKVVRVGRESVGEDGDLFWATRGGGGGNGIITSYTYRIIESPAPEPIVTRLHIFPDFSNDTAKTIFLENLQTFLYEPGKLNIDMNITSRYGGGASFSGLFGNYIELTYLGGWMEALEGLTNAGLYGENVPLSKEEPISHFVDQFETMCLGDACSANSYGLPPTGIQIWQSQTYSEMWAYLASAQLNDPSGIGNSGYICDDLGLNDEIYCTDIPEIDPGTTPIRMLVPPVTKIGQNDHKEYSTAVINAFLSHAKRPDSFLNSHGLSRAYISNMNKLNVTIPSDKLNQRSTLPVGLMVPKLQTQTLVNLANFYFFITHFNHAAAMMIPSNETAFPWRNAAIMSAISGPSVEFSNTQIGIISEEDPKLIQGYYNTLGPMGMKNWEYLYFGDNYDRLVGVRRRFDPKDIFGKPMSVSLVEREGSLTGKSSCNAEVDGTDNSANEGANGAFNNGMHVVIVSILLVVFFYVH